MRRVADLVGGDRVTDGLGSLLAPSKYSPLISVFTESVFGGGILVRCGHASPRAFMVRVSG